MNVKTPDGKEREIPNVFHEVAKAAMAEAVKTYAEAERHRGTDWRLYSSLFYRASRIENTAVELQKVLSAPHF